MNFQIESRINVYSVEKILNQNKLSNLISKSSMKDQELSAQYAKKFL